MSITAARLQTEVGADLTGFKRGMGEADRTVAAAPAKWSKSLGAGVGLGVAAAVVVRGVVRGISAGVASLREQGVVVAQTNAVIRSTEGAAHVTAGAIRDLSLAVEEKTAIDDKSVQAGANMLLTFTGIRNEVGKGNDIFDQSVAILADMSTAMGTDMKSGAIQLGKALNDPIAGITALTRVGVTFSDQQKEQIKNFIAQGKTADAQRVILRELNKEFGGSGAMFAATDAGQALKFQDAIEGIQQSAAKGLLPTITAVRKELTHFLSDPATMGQAQALGDTIAGIFSEGNLRTAAGLMTTAAGAISTAIKLFSSLPGEVQALAVGAIALKKITGIGPLDIVKAGGGVIEFIFERGRTPANPLFVADVAGGLGLGGVPGGGGGFGTALKLLPWVGFGALIAEGFLAGNANNDADRAAGKPLFYGLGNAPAKFQRPGVGTPIGTMSNPAAGALGTGSFLGGLGSVATGVAAAATAAAAVATSPIVTELKVVSSEFRNATKALRAATSPTDIRAAVARIVTEVVTKGHGNVEATRNVIRDLKSQLLTTTDPETRRILQTAIRAVEGKLPNRVWVTEQNAKAKAILESSLSTKQQIIGLKGIASDLRVHGDTNAAQQIDRLIAIEKATSGLPAKIAAAAVGGAIGGAIGTGLGNITKILFPQNDAGAGILTEIGALAAKVASVGAAQIAATASVRRAVQSKPSTTHVTIHPTPVSFVVSGQTLVSAMIGQSQFTRQRPF